MLEAVKHPHSSFVTLTYDEENLPDGATLVPKDLQLWLKRVRHLYGQCRFYGVGEYGDKSERPHYHVALFGPNVFADAGVELSKRWPLGFSYFGDLTLQSAAYICGYVTKKLTNASDERLCGRHPEFARMSLRPGIGASAVTDIAAAIQNQAGRNAYIATGDVPGVLNHARKPYPLGRYLRDRLRQEVGLEKGEPDAARLLRQQKMLAVYESYVDATEEGKIARLVYGKQRFIDEERIRALNRINRHRIMVSGKGIRI